MIDKPRQCAGCPLAEKGRGFVLGWGDPASPLSVCAEAPGPDEVLYRLDTGALGPLAKPDDLEEFQRRKAAYPEIEDRFLLRGKPLVGKTGKMTELWLLKPLSVSFDDVFRDNVLRCQPPRVGDSNYPVGEERKRAEQHCRQYDRWSTVRPQLAVFGIHPSALLREITPLPLLMRATEKARDAAKQGIKTVLLLGGKAAKSMVGFGENSTRWIGHYEWLETERQQV